MTPYYEDDSCTIYHGDCREVLPTLSNVGLVITSPPYNLSMGLDDIPAEAMHDRRSVSRRGAQVNRLTKGYVDHDDAMPQAEYVAWQRQVLQMCWAALRPDGAIYYNHKPRSQAGIYRTPLDLVPSECELRQIIIWDRCGTSMAFTANAYVSGCEWILLLARPDFRLLDRAASSLSDVWRVHPDRGGDGHPCPFPLSIPVGICDTAACNGIVVDPFMGSGTTLRAAKDAGLRAVGVDISERYCEIAARRLGQEVLAL